MGGHTDCRLILELMNSSVCLLGKKGCLLLLQFIDSISFFLRITSEVCFVYLFVFYFFTDVVDRMSIE